VSRARLFTDGGARPCNPGPAGYGIVLHMGKRTVTRAAYIGWASNNVAEYTGLVIGIKMAIENQVHGLDIYTDSQLVVGHMTQGHRRNDHRLRALIREAEKMLHKHFEDDESGERLWDMFWIPREANSTADDLCTKAIKKYKIDNPSPFSVLAGVR
jgi:ribonuclease HI